MNKTILILGSDGMVGKNIFDYLTRKSNLRTIGTSRKKLIKNFVFKFSVEDWKSDINNIPHFDVAINCIGALKDKTNEEYELINSHLPKELGKFLKKKKIKLIHISTDAVFDQNKNAVTENDVPYPKENYNKEYSMSKLNGELHYAPHITIRTSLLGIGATGLVHSIINSEDKTINGYTNQLWSGCTTLQFARLCEDIVLQTEIGKKLNNETLVHFNPIGPISKFEIIKNISEVFKLKKKVIPSESTKITRFLSSNIIDFENDPRYTNSVKTALEELKNFYNK